MFRQERVLKQQRDLFPEEYLVIQDSKKETCQRGLEVWRCMLNTKPVQLHSPKSFSLTETSMLHPELVCPHLYGGRLKIRVEPILFRIFPKLLCILDGYVDYCLLMTNSKG